MIGETRKYVRYLVLLYSGYPCIQYSTGIRVAYSEYFIRPLPRSAPKLNSFSYSTIRLDLSSLPDAEKNLLGRNDGDIGIEHEQRI